MHPPPTKKQNLHMLVVLFDRIRRTKPLTGCHYSHYSLSLLAGFLFSLLQFPHPPAPTQTLSLTLSNSVLLPSTLSLPGSLPGCLLQSSNTAAFSSTWNSAAWNHPERWHYKAPMPRWIHPHQVLPVLSHRGRRVRSSLLSVLLSFQKFPVQMVCVCNLSLLSQSAL